MANPIHHAETTKDRIHEQVQPYMADLFYRLANQYMLLFGVILLTNMILLPLVLTPLNLLPSTNQVLGFSVMLLILVFGWRFLENRYRATALFVLYTRYSQQKRGLEETITVAKNDLLEDDNALYIGVDLLEESANSLLDAIEEQGLKAHRGKS